MNKNKFLKKFLDAMKSFGFFCFSLALVFAVTVMALQDSANAVKEKVLEAKTLALSIEQASLKRFELERNVDKAIQQAIEESIRSGEDAPTELKQNADTALFELLEKEKALGEIEFFSASASSKQYSQLAFKKSRALAKSDLEENTKALSISVQSHAYLVEYSLTGGLLKNKTVFAIIQKPQSKELFIIPVDYSNKVLVAK